MQLLVRGSKNYIINLDEITSFKDLLEKIYFEEKSRNICIYQSGQPILDLDQLKDEDHKMLPIDVNPQLKGGKVSLITNLI